MVARRFTRFLRSRLGIGAGVLSPMWVRHSAVPLLTGEEKQNTLILFYCALVENAKSTIRNQ